VPIEAALLSVLETYLDSRGYRFPATARRAQGASGSGLERWSATRPLIVGWDGERITRSTAQSRIKRAFKRARTRRPTRPRCTRTRAAAHLRH
jgi:hypothetical protein